MAEGSTSTEASNPTGTPTVETPMSTPPPEQVPTAPPREPILTPTEAVTSRIVTTPTAASLGATEMPAPEPRLTAAEPPVMKMPEAQPAVAKIPFWKKILSLPLKLIPFRKG